MEIEGAYFIIAFSVTNSVLAGVAGVDTALGILGTAHRTGKLITYTAQNFPSSLLTFLTGVCIIIVKKHKIQRGELFKIS